MQEDLTIARPYAQAVFELAREQDALAVWSQMLAFLAVVVAHDDMKRLIKDPRIAAAALEGLVLDIADGRLNQHGKNLVSQLIANGRLTIVPEMAELFEQLSARAQNVLNVDISSAYPLDAEHTQVITDAVASRFGKHVEVSTNTDPNLIGGAVIKVGDHVIDLSMRGRLTQLRMTLS